MTIKASQRKVARKGSIGSKRHGSSRTRCLGMEALEQRQMLDGAAVGILAAEGESGPMPDFVLMDKNPTSTTFQQQVSPRDYLESISAWYLGAAFCGYCVSQYSYLDQMQNELRQTYPLLEIELIGINEPNQEAGNANATSGRDIPWLQDTDADGNGFPDISVELWGMSFRDVVVLNGANEKIGRMNLNQDDLADSGNYDSLKELLIEAAMEEQRPWRNPNNPYDVDNRGFVAPLDALTIINELNRSEPRLLPPPTGNDSPPPFFDANGDGFLTPGDALFVINYLNSSASGFAHGEGEASPMAREVLGLADLTQLEPQASDSAIGDPVSLSARSVHVPTDTAPVSATLAPDDANRISAVDRIFAERADEDRETIVRDFDLEPVFEAFELPSLQHRPVFA